MSTFDQEKTKFWKDLVQASEEGSPELADYLHNILTPLIFLQGKDPASGLTVMEIASSCEPNPDLRDMMDILNTVGAPVTANSYLNVMKDFEGGSIEMLQALLESGSMPSEIHGQKTLDLIAEVVEGSGQDDFFGSFFLDKLLKTGDDKKDKLNQHVQVGVTLEKDGPFCALAKEYGWVLDESGTKFVERPDTKTTSSPKSVTAIPTTTTTKKRTNKNGAGVVHCLVNGCIERFATEEKMMQHISTSSGKAHKLCLETEEYRQLLPDKKRARID